VVAFASVHVIADQTERAAARRILQSSTKRQWTQPIGFAHALFEVAVDALKRTKDLSSHASIRDAVAATNLKTVVGDVKWGGGGPFKNVSKTRWCSASG